MGNFNYQPNLNWLVDAGIPESSTENDLMAPWRGAGGTPPSTRCPGPRWQQANPGSCDVPGAASRKLTLDWADENLMNQFVWMFPKKSQKNRGTKKSSISNRFSIYKPFYLWDVSAIFWKDPYVVLWPLVVFITALNDEQRLPKKVGVLSTNQRL